jgi:hypothetical protein
MEDMEIKTWGIELACRIELQPIQAIALATIPERDFIEVALHARRTMASRLAKDGMITMDEFRAMWQRKAKV